jgi:GNAT superfamily N-acetyltransferase
MGPEGWARVRAVRLRALADAPDAFGTTLAEDEARPPASWRSRLEARDVATFVAVVEGRDVGLAVGAPYDGVAGLFAMWVAPEARRRGVGGALVGAVVEWARGGGHPRVLLDVGVANPAALALYASAGFRPTGATSHLPPPRERVLELQMALDLDTPSFAP